MMVNIMLDQMFFLLNNVVTTLKCFLEDLAKNVLAPGQGENAVFSINQIITVCGNLSEIR